MGINSAYLKNTIKDSDTEVCISTSVVLYKPDLSVLKSLLEHLELAVRQFLQINPQKTVSLHLVENAANDQSTSKIRELLNTHCANSSLHAIGLHTFLDNKGYGYANNFAAKQQKSIYQLILNPDVFMAEGSLLAAYDFMQTNKEVGLLSPSIIGTDGKRQYLCKQNPTLFIFYLRSFAPTFLKNKYQSLLEDFEMRQMDYTQEARNIPYLSGCFMFFRTSVFKKIAGFDERYFLYSEDADITRETLNVAQTAYVPSVEVVHKWSRGTHNSLRLKLITVYSAILYFLKWSFK